MEGILRLGFGHPDEATEGEYLDGEIVKTDTHGRPIRVRSSHTGRMWELRYARPDDTEATEAEPIREMYTLPSLTCARCGHTWTPRSASRPKQCPHCKQTGWETPARSRVLSLPTRN